MPGTSSEPGLSQPGALSGRVPPPAGPTSPVYVVPAPTGNATVDTENLQSVVSQEGRIIQFQPGTYVHTGLKVLSNQDWRGAGRGVTTLQLASNSRASSVVNANPENGNVNISITDLTIDGNKANQAGENNKYGIHLVRCTQSLISNVEVKNVDGHGIVIDGQGVVTRYCQLSNILAHHNSQTGVWGTFAMRDIQYVNIEAYSNGLHGIEFDASEMVASNILSRENEGRGVFIRNIFSGVFNDLRAVLNGQDGIYVQGMVYSIANNWTAAGNGTSKENEYNEVTFSGNAELSYGITNEAIVNNLQCNPSSELGKKARYGLFVGEPEKGAATFGSLKIFGANVGTLLTGSIRIPGEAARGNLAIVDWPSATSSLRWWTGSGLATPNGFQLGTNAAHLLGFYGKKPLSQQARPPASEATKLELSAIEKLNTSVEAIRKVLFEIGLTA